MKVHTDYTMSDIATDSALQVGFESSECDTAETAYGLVLHGRNLWEILGSRNQIKGENCHVLLF